MVEIYQQYAAVERTEHLKKMMLTLLGLPVTPQRMSLDLRELSNLLYRDSIEQKHGDRSRLAHEIDALSTLLDVPPEAMPALRRFTAFHENCIFAEHMSCIFCRMIPMLAHFSFQMKCSC